MDKFKDRLREALLHNSLTQGKFAERMGTWRTSVSAWLNGRDIPRANTVIKMCEVLNVSADWLLGVDKVADTMEMEFHERLRFAMARMAVTQAELSRRMGCTQNTIWGWVTGKHEPDADAIAALCKALNVSADWLLGMDKVL